MIAKTTHYQSFTPQSPYIGGYRYFFNGQEADNEMFGIGGFQNYGFRMYDTRIARFWGVDPLTKDYPMMTPFQFASCSPVLLVDVEGLEGIENTCEYTSDGVPFYYFNARQSTYIEQKKLPEVELKKPVFQQSTKQNTSYQGEIRPAPSEYERAWAESAGYFGVYIYLDPIVKATATGGLAITSSLFGQYAASDILPYAVKSGQELYSLGLKVYNNSWGKRTIGTSLGYVGYKQDWSPDVTVPDPIISTYSLMSQFLIDKWKKYNPLFDDKTSLDSKTSPQNTNDNEKSDK
jgi:RHS repeat-associated protein